MLINIEKATKVESSWIAEFQVAMALETESLQLNKTEVQRGVEKVFEGEFGFYLSAKINHVPVGCLLVLKEWSDWRNSEVWWIHSVYIHPQFRAQGVFRKMFSYVKDLSVKHNCRGLRLYVDKSNAAAQKVYQKLGMNNNHYELFEMMF